MATCQLKHLWVQNRIRNLLLRWSVDIEKKVYPQVETGVICPWQWGNLVVLRNPPHLETLPFLLFFIHGHTTRSKCHHQKKATDHRCGLKEVILEEVMHGLVGWDGPESVEVDIDS